MLRFAAGPQARRAGQPFPEIRVQAVDGFGSPAPDGTLVNLELAPPDQGARLLGTTTQQTTGGVAIFAGVTVDRGGTYRLQAIAESYAPALSQPVEVERAPLHLIVMIADGLGYKQIEATTRYTGREPSYATFPARAMATFDATTEQAHHGVGYDPTRAWSEFLYPILAATDSASSATAMYTGEKTHSGRIAAGTSGARLRAITEDAHAQGLAVGAVTSVPIPHATPGAWLAHNTSRGNYYAIADEMLWGDPVTTGDPSFDARYAGALGPAAFGAAVLLGGGHPAWAGETFLRVAMRDKLAAESGLPGAWHFVERIAGANDGGARLLAAATDPGVTRLCGMFGGAEGNLDYRRADGSGASAENPTLAEMTTAALHVLARRPDGFVLLVEGGAVDFAAHANNLDRCVGEMIGFDEAVRAVVEWVDAPGDPVDWSNTLLVVTGDHETGYLTAGPNVFPDVPLGEVNARTLALERPVVSTGQRASWDDIDGDGEIDDGETVHWAWHTSGHSNSLIPIYVNGTGASRFDAEVVGTDPVRGEYVDNTAIYRVLRDVLAAPR